MPGGNPLIERVTLAARMEAFRRICAERGLANRTSDR